MNYFTYSQKLKTLLCFIENGRVKTLKNISVKLGVSERTALRLIKRLKDEGVDIKYRVKETCYKIISAKK